jgi:mannose-1-phosphate guanylyltransferase
VIPLCRNSRERGADLKAVVLAGGYATRLRPISYAMPKLLFPVLGKPMIYWTLDLLHTVGITEVVLGVNYLAEALRRNIGSRYRQMKIKYSLENQELGTAGPMRLASTNTEMNETFVALNGDVIAEISLKNMLQQHHRSKALITDALHQVATPSRFGVVQMDARNRIGRFVEKPHPGEAPSHLVNAGIYIIEPEVLQLIPPNRKVSLEREIFPMLAKEGNLSGFTFFGYWFDIGNITDFRRANFSLLRSQPPTIEAPHTRIASDAVIRRPVSMADNSSVDSKAQVGPNVSTGKEVSIAEGAEVAYSILFDRVRVGENSKIYGAIISTDVKVGKDVRIGRGAVISPNVTIADRIRIAPGAIIHPHKEINRNVRAAAYVM